eukprot:TRINITY_DN7717_c0_g1_i1.p1 TRINITY_DN7717_c0_g1~~TRINITY_DN7717_c0_g1_i1.p1  ORF type:complete len:638 (+),score=129.16 TRINITY_DN7717_c0_g1_i1:268-1914(+)
MRRRQRSPERPARGGPAGGRWPSDSRRSDPDPDRDRQRDARRAGSLDRRRSDPDPGRGPSGAYYDWCAQRQRSGGAAARGDPGRTGERGSPRRRPLVETRVVTPPDRGAPAQQQRASRRRSRSGSRQQPHPAKRRRTRSASRRRADASQEAPWRLPRRLRDQDHAADSVAPGQNGQPQLPAKVRMTLDVEKHEYGPIVGRDGERFAWLQQDHGVRLYVPRRGDKEGSRVWVEGMRERCSRCIAALSYKLSRSVRVVQEEVCVPTPSRHPPTPRLWVRLSCAPPTARNPQSGTAVGLYVELEKAFRSQLRGFIAVQPAYSARSPDQWLHHCCCHLLFRSTRDATEARERLNSASCRHVLDADYAPSSLGPGEIEQRTLRIDYAPTPGGVCGADIARELESLKGYELVYDSITSMRDLKGRAYGRAFVQFTDSSHAAAARLAIRTGQTACGLIANATYPDRRREVRDPPPAEKDGGAKAGAARESRARTEASPAEANGWRSAAQEREPAQPEQPTSAGQGDPPKQEDSDEEAELIVLDEEKEGSEEESTF